MEAKELKKNYQELYNIMSESGDSNNMLLFGNVMTEMFDWLSENKPEKAEEWLWKLEAVRWRNYLAPKEAEKIVSEMEPRCPWSREQWKSVMNENNFDLEDKPYYNSCALWVTMCMIYSDSLNTLKKYVGDDIFTIIHDLALDKLKDKDGWFDIRNYFL